MRFQSEIIQQLYENWPSPIVLRRDVEKASAKTVSRKHLANLDSRGEGPPMFYINSKTAYQKDDFFKWLDKRVSTKRKDTTKGNGKGGVELGDRYGYLTVLSVYPPDPSEPCHNYIAHCQCDCGRCKEVRTDRLKRGDTRSCGCIKIGRYGYRGIVKRGRSYEAQVNIDGKRHSLGCFDSEEEAARQYDEAAKQFFGEDAKLNFPEEPEACPNQLIL